jgi:hypothetical protein
MIKNFLSWPIEIIRTVYTKVVDKVFGKRCACVNIKTNPVTISICKDCGKVHNG